MTDMVAPVWLVWSVLLFTFMPRQDAPEVALTFTRPTIIARPLEQPVTYWHELTFEDGEYMFVSKNFGPGGGDEPGFFVHSKSRGTWIQILAISTEHARLGHSPKTDMLPVSWDYGDLIGVEYEPMPLAAAGFIADPDRVVAMPEQGRYRLDYHSHLNAEEALTWFWVQIADLEAAFDGRRRTAPASMRPREGLGSPVPARVSTLSPSIFRTGA